MVHDSVKNTITFTPDKTEYVDKPYAFAITLESKDKVVKVAVDI
jgi:hypothetical protein